VHLPHPLYLAVAPLSTAKTINNVVAELLLL